MTYPDRIRAGAVEPWTDDHASEAEGCRRSAQIALDELGTLAADDARREEIEAQRAAWLDRAAVLEELGR